MLRAAHWKCAKRFARVVEDTERDTSADWVSTDPEPGYGFSYTLPSSMLAARYLTDFSQFTIGYETSAMLLHCNVGGSATTDAPILCYTIDVTDVTLWEPDLYQAMVYALAASISMPLHAKVERAKFNYQLANDAILTARTATANEMYRLLQQTPSVLDARGYEYEMNAPYLYPYGSAFTGTGAPIV